MKELSVDLATPVRLLVLIGGGEFSFGETRAIDEFLVAAMPGEKRTVAFLPTASGSPEYALHIGTYFARIDPSLTTTNVPIYRGRDSRRQKNVDQLRAAGMIYLGGGVTNNLLSTIRESPAEHAMREVAATGTVIAAIGAAASCFGSYTRDMTRGGVLPGLGWLTNTIVETGFDPDHDVPLRRLMSMPEVNLGLGIPPKTALAIRADGSTELIGGAHLSVFRKG